MPYKYLLERGPCLECFSSDMERYTHVGVSMGGCEGIDSLVSM